MEENKEKVPKFLVFILCICIVFIIIIAISFAVFINRQEKVIEKSENGANVVLNYSTDINGLKITKATPTTDQVGIKNLEDGEYFDFSVETKLDNAPSLDYEISIVKDKVDSNISDSDIENLADTIEQVQLAQDDANAYKDQISDFVDSSVSNISNGSDLGFSLDGLFNTLFSIFNGQH